MGVRVTHEPDFAAFERKILSAVERAMEQAVAEGVVIVKTYIATSGTPKSGKQGRIDTGRMIDSVYGDSATAGQVVSGGIGWENFAPYFQYQEEGFTSWTGATIPAMNAFVNTYPRFTELLKTRLKEEIARVI